MLIIRSMCLTSVHSGQSNREPQLAPNVLTSVSPVEEYVARKEELRPWDAGFPSEY